MLNDKRYFEVLAQLGHPNGSWKDGEIEIITDLDLIDQAEKKTGTEVGVISENKYLIYLNDAVWFAPGPGKTEPSLGTYIRLVYTYELTGNLGVFVLPIHIDGRMVCNAAFRHALRAWTVEGSGTIAKSGETIKDTIKRCMDAELGCEVLNLRELTDKFVPERGLLGGRVPIYAAQIEYEHKQVEDSTVRGHVLMWPEVFWETIARGGVFVTDGREYIGVDGYTIAAVKLAEMAGLFSPQWPK